MQMIWFLWASELILTVSCLFGCNFLSWPKTVIDIFKEIFDDSRVMISLFIHVDNLYPEVDFCPEDLIVLATGRLTSVVWDPPQFVEPSGDQDALLVSCNFEIGTELPWGTHNIICGATNSNNGKTVECRFSVEVFRKWNSRSFELDFCNL